MLTSPKSFIGVHKRGGLTVRRFNHMHWRRRLAAGASPPSTLAHMQKKNIKRTTIGWIRNIPWRVTNPFLEMNWRGCRVCLRARACVYVRVCVFAEIKMTVLSNPSVRKLVSSRVCLRACTCTRNRRNVCTCPRRRMYASPQVATHSSIYKQKNVRTRLTTRN